MIVGSANETITTPIIGPATKANKQPPNKITELKMKNLGVLRLKWSNFCYNLENKLKINCF